MCLGRLRVVPDLKSSPDSVGLSVSPSGSVWGRDSLVPLSLMGLGDRRLSLYSGVGLCWTVLSTVLYFRGRRGEWGKTRMWSRKVTGLGWLPVSGPPTSGISGRRVPGLACTLQSYTQTFLFLPEGPCGQGKRSTCILFLLPLSRVEVLDSREKRVCVPEQNTPQITSLSTTDNRAESRIRSMCPQDPRREESWCPWTKSLA